MTRQYKMSRLDPLHHTLHLTSQTLCLLLFVTSRVSGSEIVFSSSPATIQSLLTDTLTLRCSIQDGIPTGISAIIGKRDVMSDDHALSRTRSRDHAPSHISPRDISTSDIAYPHSIAITKGTEDVAIISDRLGVMLFDNSTGINATGQLPASGAEKGFLEVTWKYPGSAVSGSYQCVIHGIDLTAHMMTFSHTVEVTEASVSLSDVVGYIHELKLINDQQKQDVSDLKLVNNQQKLDISDLKLVNDQQKLVNDQQATVIGQLTTEISELRDRQNNTTVIFTAFLSSPVTLLNLDVVVFNSVITNVGGGYNPSTGVFTAPVTGYFEFSVYIRGQVDEQACVRLHHNNNYILGALADDSLDYQSASTGGSILLHKGDLVRVISFSTSYFSSDSYGRTSFSGHLINLV